MQTGLRSKRRAKAKHKHSQQFAVRQCRLQKSPLKTLAQLLFEFVLMLSEAPRACSAPSPKGRRVGHICSRFDGQSGCAKPRPSIPRRRRACCVGSVNSVLTPRSFLDFMFGKTVPLARRLRSSKWKSREDLAPPTRTLSCHPNGPPCRFLRCPG